MDKSINMEFHTHTRYSPDSFLGKYFFAAALKIKKINAVAITDHNSIEGALKYKPFLEKRGIKVIIGEEINTKEGEIAGLFLTEKVAPGLTPEETVKAIKSQGGVVYIPHPYDETRSKTVLKEEALARIKNSADLIEIHNGRNRKKIFSEKQREIAAKYGIPGVVGSDAHAFFELGRNYISIKDFSSPKELLENMKTAEFFIKPGIPFAHFVTKTVKISKLLLNGKFREIFRTLKRKIR